jgi:Domain of unknown function (DUF4419)
VDSVGCGSHEISGWITAFCVSDERGRFIEKLARPRDYWGEESVYVLNGISYPSIDEDDIPPGSAEVDASILYDSHKTLETVLIAGNMG